MRTTPIITIIRKYGLTSKRLSPKNRIKYEDALKMVTQLQNSELRIDTVIDNTRTASHNACHCGLPGCGQKIRYEYILKSKDESKQSEELVAGSTCVWPTLGMSELQKKDFFKLDETIRNHYALLDWKDANPDVVQKLETLKSNNIDYYKAFWEEIDNAPLLTEDTEFIRNTDVDKVVAAELEKRAYKKHLKDLSDADYNKVRGYIPELRDFYKGNGFVLDLCSYLDKGFKLTPNQFRWLKVSVNRMWFAKNLKNTSKDLTSSCDSLLSNVFSQANYSGNTYDLEGLERVNDLVKSLADNTLKLAWMAYRCKNAVVLR